MKQHRINPMRIIPLVLITWLLAIVNLPAATWNDARGMGNNSDGWSFTGAGTPLSVVASVQSNSLYYITSAKSSGEPWIEDIWLQNDSVAGTLRFYVATNSWQIASNGVLIGSAATNIVWLTSTNSGLATNDLLAYRGVGTDHYQLVIVSGNATDSGGLVYTNALGQCAIKVFNGATNAWAAGDLLYKLAQVQTYTPLAMGIVTNQINAVTSDHWSQWVRFGSLDQPIQFRGRLGLPSAVVMTYSNSAALQVNGQYYVRPRR